MAAEATAVLSALLRERTAAAHAEAERSPFMTALAAGRVTRDGLAVLLGRLLPVYEALEAAAPRWADDPRVGPLLRLGLERVGRLRDDVTVLGGRRETSDYAERVTEVAGRATGFVAHHYTRCLADLSGGQVVRAALERSLGIADGTGGSCFSFPGVRPAQVKQAYRDHLDAAAFTAVEREALVEEVLVAFAGNRALTADLDADVARWTSPE